eukprot:GGOE01009915.1.p1 GENE.GGOE01009915.1~~GGOE01009915.1.p1  ORF type:complete len:547 (-),score=128.15 GGOE01009915.1:640-2247(-)
MNPVLGPDIAHMAQLWERNEWNALREAEEEQPPPDRAVKGSDALQCCHFGAFFTAAHGTRHPLSPTQRMGVTVQIVLHCLRRWATEGIWLHLRRTLRARVLMRNRIRMHRSSSSRQRTETLEGWLTYWQDAEAEAHRGLQRMQSIRLVGNSGAEWASQMAQAQVMTSTCEEVKLQVLWELYWLLHAQTLRERSLYWTRWWALLRKRQKLRSQVSSLHQLRNYVDETTDFLGNDPVSLRAINATLFVMALQVPHFRYRAGEEVTLKLLLLLANAPQQVFHVNDPDAWVRPTSGVVDAFLDSSLCTDPTWLRARLNLSVPVIPLRTWRVDLLHVPRCTSFCSSEVPTEGSDEWQLLQLLEEPSSPGLLRAPTTSSYRTPTLCNSQSPRGLLRRLPSQLQLPSSRSSSFSRQRTLSVETNHSCSSPSRGSMLSRLGSFTNLQQTQGSPRQAPIFARLSSSILESPKPVMKLQSSTLSAGHATPRQITPRHTTPRLSAVPNEVELRRKASGLIRRRSFTQSADSTPSTAKVCSLPPLRN